MVEVFGPAASGKTTVALHLIAQAQRSGGLAAFIDTEFRFNVSYARILGVNTDDLLRSQPLAGGDSAEHNFALNPWRDY